jgi:HMP-PP phosphatase
MARLAAFDMDGTLLLPDHRLGTSTLSTLKRLRDRDITLTLPRTPCAGNAPRHR